MSKIYYVDSENVGDVWINLYLQDNEESKFLIFYTNRTPRIDYECLVTLMNTAKQNLEFIKCCEGNNALDFQLVTYLGYVLHEESEAEIVILSNDTGFDAVVHFWKERGRKILRLKAKNIEENSDHQEGMENTEEECVTASLVEEKKQISGVDVKELYTVINCVGRKNMARINVSFTHFYGQKNGNDIYKHMKKDSFAAPTVSWKADAKVKKYCELIYKYCNGDKIQIPADLTSFLYEHLTTKGMPTIANQLNQCYGNEQGQKIYKMLKPFCSILVEIRK